MGTISHGRGLVPDYIPDYILREYQDGSREAVFRARGLRPPPIADSLPPALDSLRTVLAIATTAIAIFTVVMVLLDLYVVAPMMITVVIVGTVNVGLLWLVYRSLAKPSR